jgi:Uma2 family endonuclease
MTTALKLPDRMTTAEFMALTAPDDPFLQLVDGVPQAMTHPNRTHSALQGQLGRLIANHLGDTGPCSLLVTPGVIPRVRSDANVRIPDLAVTCSPYETEQASLTDPVLLIEILSHSNRAETWSNVWAYTTIPSVREILVVRSDVIGADLLRRLPDGNWPERPLTITDGDLVLESIGFSVPLAALYRTTRLARP